MIFIIVQKGIPLKHYIDNTSGIKQKYKNIYSVKNEGCKILEKMR